MAALRVNIGSLLHLNVFSNSRHLAPSAANRRCAGTSFGDFQNEQGAIHG
jgi:hypothetical protein